MTSLDIVRKNNLLEDIMYIKAYSLQLLARFKKEVQNDHDNVVAVI